MLTAQPSLDSESSLKDAMALRLRHGLRLGSFLAAPVLLTMTAGEHLLGDPTPVNVRDYVRLAMMVVYIGIGIWLAPGASNRRETTAAAAIHIMTVAYALMRVAISGGAESDELPYVAIAMASLTFLLPLEPRIAFPLYFSFYLAAAWVCATASPAGTPPARLWTMHKVALLSCTLSALGSWLHHRALREMFEWRLALREESRRAALTLERARIARDLHDHIGARLTGIALRAEREQKKLPIEQRDALVWIQDTIRLCLEELRDTIWALSNSGRDARELVATLRRRAEDIADAAELRLRWTMNEEVWNGRFSPGVSVALSAILREALTNTIRHSGAKNVSVTLMRDSERITVEVSDDGKGFEATPSEGRGLNNMRSRAKEQGGEVRIETNGGKGLRVIATIPLLSEQTQQA